MYIVSSLFLLSVFLYHKLLDVLHVKVLSDDERRKTYDQHGEEGLKNMRGGDDFDPFSR